MGLECSRDTNERGIRGEKERVLGVNRIKVYYIYMV
jgi:hypothetical protein